MDTGSCRRGRGPTGRSEIPGGAGRACALLSLVAVLWACSPPEPGPLRFVRPDAARLDPERVLEVFSRATFDPASRPEWILANLAAEDDEGAGWVLSSAHEDPYLWRRTDLAAEGIDAVRLLVRPVTGWGDEKVPVQLYWSTTDPPEFGLGRAVEAGGVPAGPAGVLRFDLPVVGHPEWNGRIRALRFDLGSFPAGGASVELLGWELVRLGRAELEGPLLASLGGDHRSAWVLPPGARKTLETMVPPGASVRFAVGRTRLHDALPFDPELRELRVAVEEIGRSPFGGSDGGTERDLLRFVLPGEAGGWREARVDLGDLAGRRVRLIFEVPGPPTRSGANPTLVAGIEISAEETERAAADRSRPNVVWIVADTLRADRLSLYGYRLVTSPRIDGWARRSGAVFRRATAQSTWTLPSHVSMFTGLDPANHGVRHPFEVPTPALPSLPEALWEAGYATAAFTGGGFVGRGQGLARGFDRFDTWTGPTGAAAEIGNRTAAATEWLARERPLERPFFLFFHTYETHSPYRPREPHLSTLFPGSGIPPDLELTMRPLDLPGLHVDTARLLVSPGGRELRASDEERALVGALYDTGVAELDQRVGEILDQLERLDLERDTLVIFTSDHGESLGEDGLWGHGNLRPENVSVPLVLSWPGRYPEPRSIAAQVRLVDLAPTILDLLGIEPPAGLDGASLVPYLEGEEGSGSDARTSAEWSNRGVALRSASAGLGVEVGTGVWPELCGRSRLFDPSDPAEAEIASPDPRAVRWLRETLPALLDAGEGLRIRIFATGADVDLRFAGDPILGKSLKFSGGACPTVDERDGGLDVRVAAGTWTDLHWTGIDADALAIRLGSGPDAVDLEVLAVPEAGLRLNRIDGVWSTGTSGAEHAGPAVELEWRPGWGGRPPRPTPGGPGSVGEVESTLKSLGYL